MIIEIYRANLTKDKSRIVIPVFGLHADCSFQRKVAYGSWSFQFYWKDGVDTRQVPNLTMKFTYVCLEFRTD